MFWSHQICAFWFSCEWEWCWHISANRTYRSRITFEFSNQLYSNSKLYLSKRTSVGYSVQVCRNYSKTTAWITLTPKVKFASESKACICRACHKRNKSLQNHRFSLQTPRSQMASIVDLQTTHRCNWMVLINRLKINWLLKCFVGPFTETKRI